MDKREAAEFFYYNGNVGRSVDDLLRSQPSYEQLLEAMIQTQWSGQSKEMALEAARVIWGYGFDEVFHYQLTHDLKDWFIKVERDPWSGK